MSEIKLVRARRVKALEDYRLEIVFDDDTMGVIDLSEFVNLGPMTEPLRDPMTMEATGALRPATAAA